MMENSLEQAITFVKAGRMEEARGLLQQILRADPQNETAWLWYAAASAPGDRIKALELCLRFNPGAARARALLDKLRAPAEEQPAPGAAAPVPQPPSSRPEPGVQPAAMQQPAPPPAPPVTPPAGPQTAPRSGAAQYEQPAPASQPAQPAPSGPAEPPPASRPADSPPRPAMPAPVPQPQSAAQPPAPAFTVPPDQVTDEEFAAAQAAVEMGQVGGAGPAAVAQPSAQVKQAGDPAGGVRPGDIVPVGHRKRSVVALPISARAQAVGGGAGVGEEKPHIRPLKIQEERRRQRIAGEIPPISSSGNPGDGAAVGSTPAGEQPEPVGKKAAFRTLLLVYAAIAALGLLALLIFIAGLIIALQSGGG